MVAREQHEQTENKDKGTIIIFALEHGQLAISLG